MTIDPITMKNPYRRGSKLHAIFAFLADGVPRTLVGITNVIYSSSLSSLGDELPIHRRRVASALRTIRTLPDATVIFNESCYRLVERVKKAAVADSPPAGDQLLRGQRSQGETIQSWH